MLVLHVNDDAGGRAAITQILRAAGCTVREAATLAEGLRAANPDLVVCAGAAADPAGLHALRRLKADSAAPPVLCLREPPANAEADGEAGVGGAADWADGYLTLPVQPAELTAVARALVRTRRAAETAWAVTRQWQTLFDALGDGVCLLDRDGRILRCNRALADLVGKPAADVVGVSFRELLDGGLVPGAEPPFARMLRTGRRETAEARIGGRWFQVTADPVCGPDGTPDQAVYILTDVTARKAAEEEARAGEEKFRRLIETANEGLWILDADARITFVNPRMAEMLGYTPREMLGRQKWDFLFAEDRPAIHALFERRRAGVSEQVDVRFRHRDGREVWTIMAARPIVGERGEFQGALDLFTDVTDRRRLEHELRRQAEELARTDRRKDDFLAQLAHELRGPLAPLRNALHIMRLGEQDSATVAQARDLAERQVHQLARLVDDLLDVSRITRGKVQLRKERVDVGGVVASAVEMAKPLIEARRHHLTVLLPPAPLTLDADPSRLVQILVNLLTNAAKYTEPGGDVWLTAEGNGDEVLLSVRDTGVGLPPELIPHLFDLFVQGEPGAEGGLGIGLSLVRGLAELHGGSVVALSDGPGTGSEFVVRLPAPPAAPAEAGPPPAVPAVGRSLRILVVDDDIDGATSLGMLLRLWGHDVCVAHDGLTALEAAPSYRPEVVLLDLGLPGGLSGLEVARRLRQLAGLADVLLVALTGWGQEEDRRRTQVAGFDHHLVKPVSPEALQELLAQSRAES